jgi:hypothetical protein
VVVVVQILLVLRQLLLNNQEDLVIFHLQYLGRDILVGMELLGLLLLVVLPVVEGPVVLDLIGDLELQEHWEVLEELNQIFRPLLFLEQYLLQFCPLGNHLLFRVDILLVDREIHLHHQELHQQILVMVEILVEMLAVLELFV